MKKLFKGQYVTEKVGKFMEREASKCLVCRKVNAEKGQSDWGSTCGGKNWECLGRLTLQNWGEGSLGIIGNGGHISRLGRVLYLKMGDCQSGSNKINPRGDYSLGWIANRY